MNRPNLLYRLGQAMFFIIFKTVWRMKVMGKENIPRQGGALIAANHISLADPPVVGAASPRPIHYMAKKELFEIPVLGWLIRRVNAFPLNREEGDIGALRNAVRLVKHGEVVILFPEGTRSKTGEMRVPKMGVGLLAAKTRVPVIPTLVVNTNRLKRLPRIMVRFGKPLYFEGADDKTSYEAMARKVMGSIKAMKEQRNG